MSARSYGQKAPEIIHQPKRCGRFLCRKTSKSCTLIARKLLLITATQDSSHPGLHIQITQQLLVGGAALALIDLFQHTGP